MLTDWSTICKFDMLCLCLDCHVISSSALQFYTYFWMAMLYHLLVCKFIPMSGLQVYTYFCYKVLYLLLLWLLLLFPNLISDLVFWFAILYLRLLYPILVYSILLVMALYCLPRPHIFLGLGEQNMKSLALVDSE